MPSTTTNQQIPYPVASDRVYQGPTHFRQLAERVDTLITSLTSRVATVENGGSATVTADPSTIAKRDTGGDLISPNFYSAQQVLDKLRSKPKALASLWAVEQIAKNVLSTSAPGTSSAPAVQTETVGEVIFTRYGNIVQAHITTAGSKQTKMPAFADPGKKLVPPIQRTENQFFVTDSVYIERGYLVWEVGSVDMTTMWLVD